MAIQQDPSVDVWLYGIRKDIANDNMGFSTDSGATYTYPGDDSDIGEYADYIPQTNRDNIQQSDYLDGSALLWNDRVRAFGSAGGASSFSVLFEEIKTMPLSLYDAFVAAIEKILAE